MKKIFNGVIITALLICSVYSLSACGIKNTEYYANLINETFNGEFQILSGIEKKEYDNFVFEAGHGCFSLVSNDKKTKYTASGYPDVVDEYRVTGFYTEDDKYLALGIKIGDNIDDAKAILIKERFIYDEKNDRYEGARIRVVLTSDDNDNINSIRVIVYSTNKENIEF